MRIWELDHRIVLNQDVIDSPNLCDRFTERDLETIGGAVFQGYQHDQWSRGPWLRRSAAGMDLAMQVQKDKNFPWPSCSNVIFPLITIAALQFSARSYSNIVIGNDVVKYTTSGEDPQGRLDELAKRIGRHMSWQVLKEDKAWEEQHDLLLMNLGIVGCNFIKSYYSDKFAHTVSDLVMARDLVINYWATSVDEASRKSHVLTMSRNAIYEKAMKKIYRDVRSEAWFNSAPNPLPTEADDKHDNRVGITPPPSDEDTPYRIIEQHRYLDLDKDGYAEPYIVSIEEGSQKVVAITSRIEREEDIQRNISKEIIAIKPTEYFTKYSFIPAPDGGIYDVGFGILIGPLNESVNSGINQLLDAGTMANSNGGFLGRGAKIRGGQYTFAPWEWKRVDSTGDDLRKSLVQLPTREPSMVLFNLIGLLIQYTDRLAGTVDTMVGENPGQNTKTGVANQTLEQGMQVYTSIFKRVWRSMQSEFSKRHQLNRVYLASRVRFGDQGHWILREDYDSNPELVAPVADPRLVSDQMRVAQAEALANRAAVIPGYNRKLVERNYLQAMRIDGVDKFFPGEDVIPPPPDPKLELEKVKAQVRQMELAHEKELLTMELMEQRALNMAKIGELKAKTAQIITSIGAEKAKAQLEAFDMAIRAMESHNSMIENRMRVLKELKDSERENAESGGTGSVEGASSNPAVPADAA